MLPYDTKHLLGLCEEIDRWKFKLDAKGPLPRTWQGRLRRDLEAESITASTSMEGVAVTLEEVVRILAGDKPEEVSSTNINLVQGYQQAMEFVLRRADDPSFKWDRELLIGIHDRALSGNYALGAGRFRSGPRYVVDTTTGTRLFTPPAAESVPELVDALCEAANMASAPPPLQSAWIHVALAALHPFEDGNGRVARILSSLIMYRNGFKRPQFTSLEEWWGRHRADYYSSFSCLGEEFLIDCDVTAFIGSHVQAQISQIRALDLREQTERQIWLAFENVLQDLGIAPRLANALWDSFHDRDVTAGYYRRLTDVSPATATADLSKATACGLLSSSGRRRGRRYRMGGELMPLLSSALGLDPAIADSGRIAVIRIISDRLIDSRDE